MRTMLPGNMSSFMDAESFTTDDPVQIDSSVFVTERFPDDVAREAFELASAKLPIQTRVVSRVVG